VTPNVNVVVTSRDTLENIPTFQSFATAWHALFHLTRIATHTVTSSSLIGTPYYVPWRKPFVALVWGLL